MVTEAGKAQSGRCRLWRLTRDFWSTRQPIRSHLLVYVLILSVLNQSCEAQAVYDARSTRLTSIAANEILRRQAPDGAITMGVRGPLGSRVEPYFGNLAAIGLADAYAMTHDKRYSVAIKRWINWYDTHMNERGVVDDYVGVSGARVSAHTHDSVDSYASTFISAVWREYLVTRDRHWLSTQITYVRRALKAVESVTTKFGLTIAKPSYPIMYTMDNVETLSGLRAAANIASVLGHSHLVKDVTVKAARVELGLRKYLWQPQENAYAVAMAPNRAITAGLSAWYPDIMANLMAIAWQRKTKHRCALFDSLYVEHPSVRQIQSNNEDNCERIIWWAMAAKRCRRGAILNQLIKKLYDNPSLLGAISNTALLGHICRLCSESHPLTDKS